MKNVLAADIGGTNLTLGIFNEKLKCIFKKKYPSKEVKSIEVIINEFLILAEKQLKQKKKIKRLNIKNACFALATIIKNNNKTSIYNNNNLIIDTKKIIKKTSLKKVILINDFEAIGYSLNVLPKRNLEQIYKPSKKQKSKLNVKALIGPGTGLGAGIVVHELVLPSQGGHVDFCSNNKKEFELYEFIKRKYKNVDYELFCSCLAIPLLFQFFNKGKKSKFSKEIKALKKNEVAKFISDNYNKCKICKTTMDCFIKFLARISRNLAVTTLCYGGLFIGGGIAPKNLKLFNKKNFKDEFFKGKYKENNLHLIPIYVIKDYGAGLLGAANVAFNGV